MAFKDNGKISTVSYGQGNAGNINVSAENIAIEQGTIESFARDGAIGNSGNITVNSLNDLVLGDFSEIQAQVFNDATGNVADVLINARSIVLNEFSFIQADVGSGVTANAGNIIINAQSIELNGKLSLIISQVQSESIGNAGEIKITAPNLSLSDFSLISTNVKENSLGKAGSIFIDVDNLNITSGGVIDALTENNFDGGNITIDANNINLSDGGKIVTSGNSRGNAGNIQLNVANKISINNTKAPADSPFFKPILQNTVLESGIFASSVEGSTGNGGNINIMSGSIDFINQGSIAAVTQAGEGGNISLVVADKLSLDNNSLISAQAFNNANGGNLTIDTQFIVAYPNTNSDILASAQQGQGGNITIDAESLFGIDQRPLNDVTNDINASSLVKGLDGTIEINNANTTNIEDVIELPTNLIEPQQTTAQACQANKEAAANNRLLIRGKGGVPASPEQPLVSQNIALNGQYINTINTVPKLIETSVGKIQLARGIKINKSGGVVLTAYPTNSVGERVPPARANCNQI
ncbi:hypothetical protein NIES4102_14380 [Chondrocystis sp. NIES-4102]|nr:hypothetical protein NIES4102_14380 [Chondrocystis sp. NIES-4102]